MTLIQSSICADGDAIILMGDRMVSIEMGEIEYETEAKSTKLYSFDKFGIGFSGSLNDIRTVVQKISKTTTWKSVTEFVSYISKVFKDVIRDQQELIIKYYSHKSIDEFINDSNGNGGTIPHDLKEYIYAEISEIKINAFAIVVGFDEVGSAKIFLIDDWGVVSDETESQYYSIGSGQPFSKFYFDQHEYDSNYSLELGLFLAFRAKKASEFHPGVGCNTDIMIIKKDIKTKKDIIMILNENDKIKILDNIIKNYRENVRSIWNEKSLEIKNTVL